MTETSFPLTRAQALQRIKKFLPKAGSDYARLRNIDGGMGQHAHVSRLSAALRRRLVSEEEVISAVLTHHDLVSVHKFVSEVFWRSYWKGWLEQRPTVWRDYRAALLRAQNHIDARLERRMRHEAAVHGRTGIDCFDAWVSELAATGYLHNWARMQFASIWIFTLGLPWEVGADFMFAQLIDADPASNTLSWRWVAGLHTVGKAYLADAERIRAMTNGRFSPQGLARSAVIAADSLAVPPPCAIRERREPDPASPTLLLLTTEDLSMEEAREMRGLAVKAIAFVDSESAWDKTALRDGLDRARRAWPEADCLGPVSPDGVLVAAEAARCGQVTSAFVAVGPLADVLAPVRSDRCGHGAAFTECLRDWDRRTWPHCRKGFFALKEKIREIVHAGRG